MSSNLIYKGKFHIQVPKSRFLIPYLIKLAKQVGMIEYSITVICPKWFSDVIEVKYRGEKFQCDLFLKYVCDALDIKTE